MAEDTNNELKQAIEVAKQIVQSLNADFGICSSIVPDSDLITIQSKLVISEFYSAILLNRIRCTPKLLSELFARKIISHLEDLVETLKDRMRNLENKV